MLYGFTGGPSAEPSVHRLHCAECELEWSDTDLLSQCWVCGARGSQGAYKWTQVPPAPIASRHQNITISNP